MSEWDGALENCSRIDVVRNGNLLLAARADNKPNTPVLIRCNVYRRIKHSGNMFWNHFVKLVVTVALLLVDFEDIKISRFLGNPRGCRTCQAVVERLLVEPIAEKELAL